MSTAASVIEDMRYAAELKVLRNQLRPQVEASFKLGKEVVSVRKMSDVQCAWLGAMIDADGCIHHVKNDGGWIVTVINTNVEIISTVLRFVGTGYIGFTAGEFIEGVGNRKDKFVWRLSKQQDIRNLLNQIMPYSIKTQAKLAYSDSLSYI